MIKLKQIDNPFTDDYLYSFNCFRNEKLFYDCVKRKTISSDDTFLNLQYSFYTYLLIGNSNEWLGYILFHNEEFINNYLSKLNMETISLLMKIIHITKDELAINLLKEIKHNPITDTTSINDLNDKIDIIREEYDDDSLFLNYEQTLNDYIQKQLTFFNIDIIIALPFNTDINLIEANYYGFIKEVYMVVDNLIGNYFQDVPIILTNNDIKISILRHDKEDKVKSIVYK